MVCFYSESEVMIHGLGAAIKQAISQILTYSSSRYIYLLTLALFLLFLHLLLTSFMYVNIQLAQKITAETGAHMGATTSTVELLDEYQPLVDVCTSIFEEGGREGKEWRVEIYSYF